MNQFRAQTHAIEPVEELLDRKSMAPEINDVSRLSVEMAMPKFLSSRRVYAHLKRSLGWRIVADEEGTTSTDPSIA